MEKLPRLNTECMTCLIRKFLMNAPEAEETKRLAYFKDALKTFANAPDDITVTELSMMIKKKYPEFFPERDFSSIKQHFNELLLTRFDEYEQLLKTYKDPLLQAIKMSLVANYIDFSAFENVSEDTLNSLIENAEKQEISLNNYEALKKDLVKARKLLYITDNCGEIVMDKLLIRQIKKNYPQLKITVMVRGGEAGNDASMVDAKQIGLTQEVDVIDNGEKIATTILEHLDDTRMKYVNEADLIIAKGQANAENMTGCGLNVYYLLLCKCQHFANMFKTEKMNGALQRELD